MTAQMPSSRLQPLQQLAESREEDAARRLLDEQRQLSDRELRLHELTRYLSEYEALGQAHSAQLLMNRQAFLARLREAIAVQERLVQQARSNCDTERARWLLQRREVSTLDQLADCYRRREQRIEEQRGQRQLDEFALRRFVVARAEESRGEAE